MKFKVMVYANEWQSKTMRGGKVIKQKTFTAVDWDEAEMKSCDMLRSWADELGEIGGWNLSRVG